jgi:hypothetical protein
MIPSLVEFRGDRDKQTYQNYLQTHMRLLLWHKPPKYKVLRDCKIKGDLTHQRGQRSALELRVGREEAYISGKDNKWEKFLWLE